MISDFVGIPHEEFGREMHGADCYGLLRLIYKGDLGITLPSHDVNPKDFEAVDEAFSTREEEWVKIDPDHAERYDVVLLKIPHWHVGIVTRRGMMLHMVEGKSSIIEPFTTGRHSRRVEGIYRHISRV